MALSRMASVNPFQRLQTPRRWAGQGAQVKLDTLSLGKTEGVVSRVDRLAVSGSKEARLCLAWLAIQRPEQQTEDLIHDSWPSGSQDGLRKRKLALAVE